MKLKKFAVILLTFVLLLSACQNDQPSSSSDTSNFPVTIRGEIINEAPQTLVSLSPALTQILIDMGYEDKLVGVSDFCAVDNANLKRCGTVQSVDVQTIIELKPDYVITQSALTDNQVNQLLQADIDTVTLGRALTVDELKQLYTDVAKMIEGAQQGETAAAAFYQAPFERLDQLKETVGSNTDEEITFLYLTALDATIATGDTFENDILEYIGLTNLAHPYSDWQIPEENLANFTPDIIFYNDSLSLEEIQENEFYQDLDATFVAIDVSAFETQSLSLFTEMENAVQQALLDFFA